MSLRIDTFSSEPLCVMVKCVREMCVWTQTADQAARARAPALTDTQSAQCLSQQPANQITRSAGQRADRNQLS